MTVDAIMKIPANPSRLQQAEAQRRAVEEARCRARADEQQAEDAARRAKTGVRKDGA